jgi:hypothetical protein
VPFEIFNSQNWTKKIAKQPLDFYKWFKVGKPKPIEGCFFNELLSNLFCSQNQIWLKSSSRSLKN